MIYEQKIAAPLPLLQSFCIFSIYFWSMMPHILSNFIV